MTTKEMNMSQEQIEWLAAAKRLMRAAGPLSGWPEIADKGDSLFPTQPAKVAEHA